MEDCCAPVLICFVVACLEQKKHPGIWFAFCHLINKFTDCTEQLTSPTVLCIVWQHSVQPKYGGLCRHHEKLRFFTFDILSF